MSKIYYSMFFVLLMLCCTCGLSFWDDFVLDLIYAFNIELATFTFMDILDNSLLLNTDLT